MNLAREYQQAMHSNIPFLQVFQDHDTEPQTTNYYYCDQHVIKCGHHFLILFAISLFFFFFDVEQCIWYCNVTIVDISLLCCAILLL